jgi:hypothetical protein
MDMNALLFHRHHLQIVVANDLLGLVRFFEVLDLFLRKLHMNTRYYTSKYTRAGSSRKVYQ